MNSTLPAQQAYAQNRRASTTDCPNWCTQHNPNTDPGTTLHSNETTRVAGVSLTLERFDAEETGTPTLNVQSHDEYLGPEETRQVTARVTGSRCEGLTQRRFRQRWSISRPSGISPTNSVYETRCAGSR